MNKKVKSIIIGGALTFLLGGSGALYQTCNLPGQVGIDLGDGCLNESEYAARKKELLSYYDSKSFPDCNRADGEKFDEIPGVCFNTKEGREFLSVLDYELSEIQKKETVIFDMTKDIIKQGRNLIK